MMLPAWSIIALVSDMIISVILTFSSISHGDMTCHGRNTPCAFQGPSLIHGAFLSLKEL